MAILPFAHAKHTFLIYNGFIKGPDILIGVLLQMIWLLMLILTGRTLMKALKKWSFREDKACRRQLANTGNNNNN